MGRRGGWSPDQWAISMDKDFTLENVVLSTPCPACKDGGREYDRETGEAVRCGVCNGASVLPTMAGRKVLDFMKAFARTIQEDLNAAPDPFVRWREGSGDDIPNLQHCQ